MKALRMIGTPRPSYDTTDRVFRVLDRMFAYRKLAYHTWRAGASAANLLRTQFPFVLPDAATPPMVTVEFTNICNLKCGYCTSPLALRPQGYMSSETFEALVRSVRADGIERLRVVGNGEPTLHPEFARFVRMLAPHVHLSVLSNGNWKKPEISAAIIEAPVHLMEVTVGGLDAHSYARNRVGGKLDRVLHNLAWLRTERRRSKTKIMIVARLNLRPSDLPRKPAAIAFWKRHVDVVYPQYVSYRKAIGNREDVFLSPQQEAKRYPRCTLTLKDIDVEWDGTIPLCSGSASQLGPPGLVLGNIRDVSLRDVWNGPLMSQYRAAHRSRNKANMPICRGCGQGV